MQISRRAFTNTLAAGAAQKPGTVYDVAVIGAGVFGAWTAYFLRRRGQSVALVDAYGPANSRASSGGESRIIRMGYGSDEIYTQWSLRSLSLWREFFRQRAEVLFHRTGVLWFGHANHAQSRESRRVLRKFAIPFETLDERELARRYPQIQVQPGMIAVLEPDSGALMARRCVQALAEEAVRAGCAYIPAAVSGPAGKGRLDSVRTLHHDAIRAGLFVFACGPWLGKVFPDLLGSRIFPTRQEVFFFGVPPGDARFAPPAMPVWIDFSDPRGPYGFPDLENRGFKLAFDIHGPRFDPDTGSRLVNAKGSAAARSFLAGRFPALTEAPLVESRVCQYENTSSGDFLIDRHPDFSNVWLVGGGSGHGFKHGPALGEYVTARLLDGDPVERRFSLATKERVQHRSVY